MADARSFRIFVCSTFKDLEVERNALQERVWPELAARCARHGFRFQAIDLRWGVRAAELAALDRAAATEVDYVADRDAATPAAARGRWAVCEDTVTIAGKRKRDPTLTLRRVFVHSSAPLPGRRQRPGQETRPGRRRPGPAGARARRPALPRPGRGHRPGRGDRPGPPGRRLPAHRRRRRPATGKPTLVWSFDQAAIDAEAAADGWYALLTNLPADVCAAEVLARYKGQEAVERRYGTFKGPLAVAPMFLHNNRRIAALITVICLALLIFCLVERQVRRAIAPATTLDGLGPGRPRRPTGRLIFGALTRLRLIPAHHGQPAIIPRPGPVQAEFHVA